MVSRMAASYRSEDLTVHRFGRTEAAAPTLLLLHGLTDSGRCWPDAVARWQDDYRVLAWDARGHGESERFAKGQLAAGVGETHLADLEEAIEALQADGVDRPILVGHSMGAGTAAALAGRRPDLIRAVVLEDPALGNDRYPEAERGKDARRRVAEARATMANPRATKKQGKRDHPDWPKAERGPWLEAKLMTDLAMLADPVITVHTPWQEVTAAVSVPGLLVLGQRGIWTGDLRSALLGVHNDRLEIEVVPGAGHCARRDRPDSFHQLVDPWVAKQFATNP